MDSLLIQNFQFHDKINHVGNLRLRHAFLHISEVSPKDSHLMRHFITAGHELPTQLVELMSLIIQARSPCESRTFWPSMLGAAPVERAILFLPICTFVEKLTVAQVRRQWLYQRQAVLLEKKCSRALSKTSRFASARARTCAPSVCSAP